MKNNLKEKREFDSVKMMRDIRDHLIEVYKKNPRQKLEDLKKIRQKYKFKISKKKI